ncbi:MAG: hypothetical protein GF341_02190 [candidate division Zixibacteria bacterium]|nr:hypothetical protein [candidate division Zixibacteria bacterium]
MVARFETTGAVSLLTNFKIGHASSEQFMLYYVNRVTWYERSFDGGGFVPETSPTVASGIGGIGVTYFFKRSVPSVLVHGGGGLAAYTLPFEDGTNDWSGYGLWFGGGYEFSRHWTFDVGVGITFDDPRLTSSVGLNSAGVSVNYLAY